MAHRNIHATIWAPLDELTLADLEDMTRTARLLGADDSCPVWAERDDDSDRLNIGTVVKWRAGDL